MKVFTLRKRASAMAMGIALATGAVAATGAFGTATTAHAQKPEYSKEWRAAFVPFNEKISAEGADVAALKSEIPAIVALAKSGDEKLQTGQMIHNAGTKSGDSALRLQGMELMLASGKVPETALGQYNFIAYQLTKQAGDLAKSRSYLQKAIDYNYTSENVSALSLQLLKAEALFSAKQFREGLSVLGGAIETQKASGQPVDEAWYRRAVGMATQNKVVPEVYDFTTEWVAAFPTEQNWRDAINLTRQLNEFEGPEALDLLRLSRKVGTLDQITDISSYVEQADARRLPLEVQNLIEEAFSSGSASRDDIYLSDQLGVAKQRLTIDRESLSELESDANVTTTDTVIVMAAGDTFYSYGDFEKAERFFAKAAEMPGARTQVALTRLGMAQVELGKIDEAQATFAKIEGKRMPIAALWSAYAEGERPGG